MGGAMVGDGVGGVGGAGGLGARPVVGLTFLFTSPQNAPRLLERLGSRRYKTVFDAHQEAVHQGFLRFGGLEVERDPGFVAFNDPIAALNAAAAVVKSVVNHRDRNVAELGIGIGIHFGDAIRVGDEFVGLEVHRAARICAVANDGQTVLSEAMVNAVSPNDQAWKFKDLGRHRLKDLGEPQRLFQLLIDGVENDFPPLRSLEAFPTNLPVQLTPFIGRERDVTHLSELIRDREARLVTLLGPGGVGKTRLALQAAASCIEEFEDGVYFVALASVQDPDFVLSAIAQVIGISETGGSLFDAVINFFGSKHLLLVLDNFEHVISAAPVIDSLLKQTPGLGILATSRTRLKIEGEQGYSVEPFNVPELERLPPIDELARFDSISLFIDRAQAVKPHFSLTTTNAKAIAGICTRVDGIALAIELAAARTKLFTPQALLTRLDKQLPVLKGSHRDVSSRQITLKNTIEWSYNLLHDNEKTLLNRLAIFTGGFTSEAARQVCDPNAQLNVDKSINALAENNLVQRQQTGELEESRFYMLSLITEFAYNQLKNNQEAYTLHTRHTSYFLQFAEQNSDQWWRTGSGSVLDSLKRDDANLRAALDWASSEKDDDTSIRLIAACAVSWAMHNPLDQIKPKIETVVSRAVSESAIDADLIAGGLMAAAWMYFRLGDFVQIDNCAHEILALPATHVSARYQAIAWYLMGLDASERSNDWDRAQFAVNRADELAQLSNTTMISNWVRTYLGRELLMRKSYNDARNIFNDLIPRLSEMGDTYSLAIVFSNMGSLEVAQCGFTDARRYYLKALDMATSNRLIQVIPDSLAGAATVLEQEGNFTQAAQVLSYTDRFGRDQGLTLFAIGEEMQQKTLTSLHDHLTDEEFQKAWDQGQTLSLDETIALIKNSDSETIKPPHNAATRPPSAIS